MQWISELTASWSALAVPGEIFLLLALALLISASGFIRVVYFVSIGYAYSIAAMAIGTGILFFQTNTALHWVQLGLMVIYGIRLGTYILLREKKSAYKTELKDVQSRGAAVNSGKKLAIWIGVSVLYVTMFASPLFRQNQARLGLDSGYHWLPILGMIVMAFGLSIEALADLQKSRYKQKNPKDFCNTGLYRIVRCPNYLGEILFWTGVFITGMAAFTNWLHWVMSAFGYICIVLIMMGSTKRLEAKQDERYGDRENYQKYVKEVPVLFPFVPVYSLKNIKVYLE